MIAGAIYMFAGATAPSGFLVCDGSAVSRETYAKLYAVIGTTYGVGDGTSTFNLPDLSGRVAMGLSSSHTLASNGGEETHALQASEMPAHTHTIPQHTHAHTIVMKTPSLSHTISTQPAFNYNKPNGTAGTQSGNGQAYNGTSSTTASLGTNVAVTAHAASNCTMGGSITDCNAFDSGNNGSGSAHQNMQPFLTLYYIISTGD